MHRANEPNFFLQLIKLERERIGTFLASEESRLIHEENKSTVEVHLLFEEDNVESAPV